MAILTVSGVCKAFPGKDVLRDVSFSLPGAGTACLVGPNGSGKTTLLKTLCTLLSPDKGSVLLDGVDVHAFPREAKRRLGFASTEDHSFYGRLSARGNLWFYAQLFGLDESSLAERLVELSEELELDGILDKPFRELSNGQKQRMLLARALLHDPGLLLLDEPHQNLDPGASLRLRGLLSVTWPARGKTVLVSTHHLDEARRISDRWLVISEGRLVFDGSIGAAARARPDLSIEALFQALTSRAAERPTGDARA